MTETSGPSHEQLRLVLDVIRAINSNDGLASTLATLREAIRADGWGHAAILVWTAESECRPASDETRDNRVVVPVRGMDGDLGEIEVAEPVRDRDAESLERLERFADLAAVAIASAAREERLRRDSGRALDDELTGLPNERGLEEALRREVERAYRLNLPFSLVVLDVDRLSRINELHGSAAGDAAIRGAAAVLRPGLRQIDVAARIEGGEFCVLLPGARSGSAREVAERLRCAIAATNIPGVGTVTATFGVASLPEHAANAAALVMAARAALGVGKRRGRNRVAVAIPVRS